MPSADSPDFLAAVVVARAHLGEDPTPATIRKARAATAAPTPVACDRVFKNLVAQYRASEYYTDLAPRTVKEYDRHIATLLDALGSHQVAAIHPSHVRMIMRKFSTRKTLGRAIKRTLSVILTFAVEEEWIATNPAFDLEKKRRSKRRTEDEHGDRIEAGQRPLEEIDIALIRLSNPVGTRRRATFEALLATGFRRGDLRRVPANLAELEHVALITNKRGVLVVAPVTSQLRQSAIAWNKTRAETGLKPSRYLICSEKGTPLHERTVSADISAAFAAAGLPNRGTHSLRYTAAVRLYELGVDIEDIAEYLGHSTAEMTRK